MIEESKLARRLEKMDTIDDQAKFIKYTIRQLEKKQIAESVSKLQRV